MNEETVRITLQRSREYYAKLRAYKVRIDGEEAGTIRDGQTEAFQVSPGKHTLEIRIDWCRSNTLVFDTDAGDLDFECHSAMNTLPKLMLAVLFTTIWFNKALIVSRKWGADVAMAA